MRNTKLAALGAALILSTSTAGAVLAQESTTETTVTREAETQEDNDFPWGLLGLLGLLGLAGLRKKDEPVRRDTPAQGSSTIRPT
jgi:MYXO-CTERM domain-containing protein